MSDVFLSYARVDDETFDRRLYDQLTENGFSVWWSVSKPNLALNSVLSPRLTALSPLLHSIDGNELLHSMTASLLQVSRWRP